MKEFAKESGIFVREFSIFLAIFQLQFCLCFYNKYSNERFNNNIFIYIILIKIFVQNNS